MAETVKFSSRLNTFVTLLGYSVGQTDFWRFPFLVYRNGGGSFLIPFVVILLLCGIPLYFLEYSTSKFSGKGPYRIWDMCPLFRGIGPAVALASYVYIIAPTVFRSWLIGFFINAFRDPLPWSNCNNPWNTINCRQGANIASQQNGSYDADTVNGSYNSMTSGNVSYSSPANNSTGGMTANNSTGGMTAAEEFWQYKVLELSGGLTDLNPMLWRHFGSVVFQRMVVFIILIRSIKWIEKVMYVTTFIPLLLTISVFVSSLCQPGAMAGLYHYFYPNFDMLLEIRVWIEASLMVFYTISFGWGLLVMLGSRADFSDNPLRNAIIVPIVDALFAIFTGMVCFSVLGNMAHSQNIDVTEVIQAGMSTGIVSYVTALTSLPFPQIWAVCFFFAVLLSGLDSQMIVLEMVIQVAGEMFPKLASRYRLYTLATLSAILALASLPLCTGAGVYIFLFSDWYVATWIGPIVAFIELIIVAWVYGMDQFSLDVSLMTGRSIGWPIRITLAFITPLIVLIIFISSCVNYVPPTYGSYHYPTWARITGWLIVAGLTSPILVYAIYNVLGNKGDNSCSSTVRDRLEPCLDWGPAEESVQDGYHAKCLRFRGRKLTQLFFFNLTGSYHEQDKCEDNPLCHMKA